MTRSVEQDVERDTFVHITGGNWFAVRSDWYIATAGMGGGRGLFAGNRRSGWRVKRSLAPARRQAERRSQCADQGKPKKRAFRRPQDAHSVHAGSITKQANKAKSGFLFFQLAQPFLRLKTHVLWRRPAKTDAAPDRPVNREHAENLVTYPRLNFAHRRDRQTMQRNAGFRRFRNNAARRVMCLAERNFQRAHQPVGEVGRGSVSFAGSLLHLRGVG